MLKIINQRLTLIHMHKLKGRVAMMRRTETKARRRAQHPGPSGSAAKEKKILFYLMAFF